MALEVKELNIQELFGDSFLLHIPDFQREYVWEADQAMQLLDDIAEACLADRSPYFLGSLVLVGTGDSGKTWDVIDGQQRMITLTLLLAALRDLEEDPPLRDSLDRRLNDLGDPVVGRKASPRLILRELDREFMRSYVQQGSVEELFALTPADTTTHAQRRIIENTRAIYDNLSAIYDTEQRRSIAEYLYKNVIMVMVGSTDYADAYRMFHVLNDRGIPLTAADILKARIISATPEESRSEYARIWDSVAEKHGGEFEEFLRTIYVVEVAEPLSGDLIEEFPNRLLSTYEPDRAHEFIDDVVVPYSDVYERISRPDNRLEDSDIWTELDLLRQYQTHEWYSAAMWILRTYKDNPPTAAELLHHLERVTGVDAVAQTTHSQRIGRIVQIIRDLKAGAPHSQIFRVSDELRRRALGNLRGAFSPRSSLVRIILQRANAQARGVSDVSVRRSINALRVIPSKNSTIGWKGLSPAQQDYWYDRLGNIVLSTVRPASLKSSTDFATRRKKLLEANDATQFPFTAELSSLSEWSDSVLNERQDRIVTQVSDYWSIRRDSEGIDLAVISEDRLLLGSRASSQNGRQVKTTDLLRVGLVNEGDIFIWERPRLGHVHKVAITAEGRFRLEDGSIETSASAAARAVSGSAQSGLRVWKRQSDGKSLSELNERYSRRI
ncbi:DUF262 domain-containing protein [Actinomycetaceae bacterium L2_0104]